jgi:hypothetical protein
MVEEHDWRLQGQERWLAGVTLRWSDWYAARTSDALGPWDHDHCDFCTVHLSDHVLSDDPNTQLAGYTTEDGYHWICRTCFEDFKERFGWVVVEPGPER